MLRYSLRDDQWGLIKDFLPGREGYIGDTAADNHLFVEAVLYRYRAGIPWRTFLPVSGTGKTCTSVCAAGVKVTSSNEYFVIWPLITTTNT